MNGAHTGQTARTGAGPRTDIRLILGLWCLLLLLVPSPTLHAQACCSAGVPLTRGLQLSAPDGGALQFAITYDVNILQDVFSGTDRLSDDTRERDTRSALIETAIGLGDGWSVVTLFSFVRQGRQTRNTFTGSTSRVAVSGLGDALFVLSYSPLRSDIVSQTDLSIGAGLTLPIGVSDARLNGILLPADLQPGTGSWDTILRIAFAQGFTPLIPLVVFSTATYRLTGSNRRYGPANEGYGFGDEATMVVGTDIRSPWGVDGTLAVLGRHTRQDRFGSAPVPNTGGSFMFLSPAVTFHVYEAVSLKGTFQVPVFQNVSGTQLASTVSGSISLFVGAPSIF